MRTRSKARQRAVEALFEAEQRGVSVSDVFSRNPEVNDYAIEIAQLVELNNVRIDELISTYSQDWQISRMPAVDRAIVRIGVAELLYRSELETGVVISEAMEIAQNLSTLESAKFLNGLLSNIGAIRSNLSTL
jgi:N utilization substance protein B